MHENASLNPSFFLGLVVWMNVENTQTEMLTLERHSSTYSEVLMWSGWLLKSWSQMPPGLLRFRMMCNFELFEVKALLVPYAQNVHSPDTLRKLATSVCFWHTPCTSPSVCVCVLDHNPVVGTQSLENFIHMKAEKSTKKWLIYSFPLALIYSPFYKWILKCHYHYKECKG